MRRICIVVVPEIILAKEAVVLSLFDSDVDGSSSAHGFQEITDVDGLVRR